MNISPQDREICLQVLQQISEAPSVIDHDERMKGLIAKIHTEGKKGKRKSLHEERMQRDRDLSASSQLVQNQRRRLESGGFTPALTTVSTSGEAIPSDKSLNRPILCYICKIPFRELHWFYHQLCPQCAALNWEKRGQSADLNGRIALLTGGRIKIGYELALRLLRDGAQVILTTRFPRDAARRFSLETDFGTWNRRLHIHGLDLRDVTAVESFAETMLGDLTHLDILIHNAAQTVKRPLAFYQHLLKAEQVELSQSLSDSTLALVDGLSKERTTLLECHPLYPLGSEQEQFFPAGQLDADGQQLDARPHHSWRSRLHEVSTLEMLEVQLVNAVAPFVLNAKLQPLLESSPHSRRFIVNVSAMEGQFARRNKTCFHPHTNMAKAALNMMTRTSAGDLATRGIYMNSVDTGWITDENPTPIADGLRETHGFYTPLDAIDGASRIYDPIAQGMNLTEDPLFGHFLKDYQSHAW